MQHTAPDGPGLLAEILAPVCALPVCFPDDGQAIERGQVFLAPPNRHLVLGENSIRVTRGPRENSFRPSIDVLFRSAATACDKRVIGAILTGYLDDGASVFTPSKSAADSRLCKSQTTPKCPICRATP